MDNFINKFQTEEEFSLEKERLNQLKHYTTYTEDIKQINCKENPNHYVTFIVDSVDSEDVPETYIEAYNDISGDTVTKIPLNEGVNVIHNEQIKYGWKFFADVVSGTRLNYTSVKLKEINMKNYHPILNSNSFGMFSFCSGLTSLDLSNFDTSNVINMSSMFYYCSGLTSLDLSSFDTSKVTNMCYMFYPCFLLTSLDASNFDTSNVIDMMSMFSECTKLTSLDLSNFDTSKVTNMCGMFENCMSLTSLDLSSFDTSKVTDMSRMFNSCISLTHIKCKQTFKDWCLTNQDTIELPTAMRNGGSGQWEIID